MVHCTDCRRGSKVGGHVQSQKLMAKFRMPRMACRGRGAGNTDTPMTLVESVVYWEWLIPLWFRQRNRFSLALALNKGWFSCQNPSRLDSQFGRKSPEQEKPIVAIFTQLCSNWKYTVSSHDHNSDIVLTMVLSVLSSIGTLSTEFKQ